MGDLNSRINTALEGVEAQGNHVKQYCISNEEGLVYSRFLGWVKRNGEVYGHLFDKQELEIVCPILKEFGYENIRTDVDKVGTMFAVAVDSPFANPFSMLKLFIGTIFVITLCFLLLSTF